MNTPCRRAHSLLELTAIVAIMGLVAAIVWPWATQGAADSKAAACEANRRHIEVQAEIWRHNTGAWPAANLSDIGGDATCFPSGLPACPVSGAAYTIDSSGRVVGHSH